MKLKIFTVYDSVVGAYLQPFYMQSTGAAVRSFQDTVNQQDHHFAKHPADYTLFEIGEFDDADCSMTLFDAKVSLGCAIDFVQQLELPDMLKPQSGDE